MKEQTPVKAQLVEVVYENEGQKAVMTFVDFENGNALEVNFNKQVYDAENQKWNDDEAKALKVAEWSEKYFNTDFDHISDRIGDEFEVYRYDNFNSLYPVDVVAKFTKDDVDDIFQTKISEVVDDGTAIKIRFEHDGKTYESKMTYGKYVESLKKWFDDPIKHEKTKKKFEDKFGVPVEQADKLKGKPITIEVKLAFKKFPYAEIKKLKK